MSSTDLVPAKPRARRAAALLLVALLAAPAWAEIGAIDDGSAAPAATSIYVFGIIDDGDPIPGVWREFAPLPPQRKALNPQGEANGDGRPALLVHPASGTPFAAWAKNSPDGYDIVLSRFVGGGWTAPEVLAGSSADELDPALAVNPADGSVHLLYAIDDATPRVMWRWAPADLSSWSAPVQVSRLGDAAFRPSAVFHDGLLRVVHEVHDGGPGATPRRIVLATYDGQVPFLSETVATTAHAGPNWPEVHAGSGRLWVDWIDGDDSMAWRRRTASATWDPVLVEPFAGPEERDWHVRGLIKLRALE